MKLANKFKCKKNNVSYSVRIPKKYEQLHTLFIEIFSISFYSKSYITTKEHSDNSTTYTINWKQDDYALDYIVEDIKRFKQECEDIYNLEV